MSGKRGRMAAGALAAGAAAALAALAGGWLSPQPVRLPAGFPADVPLPEGARLRAARDQGARGLVVVLEAPGGPPAALAAGFEGRMRAAGWAVVERVVLDAAAYTSFRKGERAVAVGVGGAAGAPQMSLSVVERPYNEFEEGA